MPTLAPVLHVVLTPTPAAWLDIGKGPYNPRATVDVSHDRKGIYLSIENGVETPEIRVVGPDGVKLGRWIVCNVLDYGDFKRVSYDRIR